MMFVWICGGALLLLLLVFVGLFWWMSVTIA